MTRRLSSGPASRYWEWLVGTRYVRSRQRNGFVSFISLTSMAGIAVGVMVLIVVLSVVNGFERELRKNVPGRGAERAAGSYLAGAIAHRILIPRSVLDS